MTIGVPQGAVISPLLFSLFVNDITTFLQKFKIVMYADDTTLLASHSLENIQNGTETEKERVITLKVGEVTVSDPKEVADIFSEFFEMESQDVAVNINLHSETSGSIFPVTEAEVREAFGSVSPKYSCGLDGIPPFIMRLSKCFVVTVLTFLINLMFGEGKFPDKLKKAKIVPVLEKGSNHDLNNYRPVSILPCFSKIVEWVIYRRFYNFFQVNKLISPSQFSFLPGLSCEKALYRAIDVILTYMDKGEKVATILFDLCKAFDSVNHCLLLRKLEGYGIRGPALDLINSYLMGRTQTVCIDNGFGGLAHSDRTVVKTGVPQGSILGPLLFLIYINDLSHSLCMADLFQFADDTALIIHDKDIDELSARENDMTLNLEKTKAIHFAMGVPNQSVLVRSSTGFIRLSN